MWNEELVWKNGKIYSQSDGMTITNKIIKELQRQNGKSVHKKLDKGDQENKKIHLV